MIGNCNWGYKVTCNLTNLKKGYFYCATCQKCPVNHTKPPHGISNLLSLFWKIAWCREWSGTWCNSASCLPHSRLWGDLQVNLTGEWALLHVAHRCTCAVCALWAVCALCASEILEICHSPPPHTLSPPHSNKMHSPLLRARPRNTQHPLPSFFLQQGGRVSNLIMRGHRRTGHIF